MIPSVYIDKLMTCLLTPLSWLYGAAVYLRNKMFDKHFLRQERFDVPVVSVGNITVGGTGKTPHVEYIVSQLCHDYKIAILSRGYKRKTRGYVLANMKSTPDTIGDEPYQLYQKFGMMAKIAVCEKRTDGVKKLLKDFPDISLIILDDAFQHRYIKPKVSVLLMDYNRPVYDDKLLPLGRLRESEHGVCRADIVVVTKCPPHLQPIDYRLMIKNLQLQSFQKPFFSRYSYLPLRPVFPDDEPYAVHLDSLTDQDSIMLLTGVANPRYFVRHFRDYNCRKKICHFPDHHNFTRKDIDNIAETFHNMKGRRKVIVTTEKDAVRLSNNPYFPKELKPYVHYQPIEVKMLEALGDSDLIGTLRKGIEEKENPLNYKYQD